MQISFLIHNAYGIGGTIRTTYNLANTLAEQHDVEIVSVLRHRDEPVFALDPRVRARHLVDIRKNSPGYDGDDPAYRAPAQVFPRGEVRYDQYSALTDRRIADHLSKVDSDVVIGTRPGLNVHLARETRRGPLRVGQEHLTLDTHSESLRDGTARRLPAARRAHHDHGGGRGRVPREDAAARRTRRGRPQPGARARHRARGRLRQVGRGGRAARPGQAVRPADQGLRPGPPAAARLASADLRRRQAEGQAAQAHRRTRPLQPRAC